MSSVHADTPVVITMKALLAGVVGFLLVGGAVLWAVLTFTIGGVRDDVTAIRNSVSGLQTAVQTTDKGAIERSNEINSRLTDQIQGLRTDFVKYSERFDGLSRNLEATNKSIFVLGTRIDKLQAQLASASDPKQAQAFAEYLKKYSGKDIAILPLLAPPTSPQ